MRILVLDGWRAGLNKVALTKLLRERTDISLAAAKRQVDRLLDGDEVGILVDDRENVQDLVRDIETLGASARTISVEVGATAGRTGPPSNPASR